MDILKQPCLVLNKHWQPIDEIPSEVAICNLFRGSMRGIDTESMRALPWIDWVTLPIRESDLSIRAVSGPVRLPRVVVAAWAGMPETSPKLGRRGVAERDKYRCAYSNEVCLDGTLDHVKARSHGGKTTWENVVWSRKDINHAKGNKTLAEAGLTLLRKPFKPQPIKACMKITAKHPEWEPFVYR